MDAAKIVNGNGTPRPLGDIHTPIYVDGNGTPQACQGLLYLHTTFYPGSNSRYKILWLGGSATVTSAENISWNRVIGIYDTTTNNYCHFFEISYNSTSPQYWAIYIYNTTGASSGSVTSFNKTVFTINRGTTVSDSVSKII